MANQGTLLNSLSNLGGDASQNGKDNAVSADNQNNLQQTTDNSGNLGDQEANKQQNNAQTATNQGDQADMAASGPATANTPATQNAESGEVAKSSDRQSAESPQASGPVTASKAPPAANKSAEATKPAANKPAETTKSAANKPAETAKSAESPQASGPVTASKAPPAATNVDHGPAEIASPEEELLVIKRGGGSVPYDEEKIVVAICKAYLAVEGGQASVSSRIREKAEQIAAGITNKFLNTRGLHSIDIEHIQDQVELHLMRSGDHKVARSYILYREERTKERQEAAEKEAAATSGVHEEAEENFIIVNCSPDRHSSTRTEKKLPKSFIKERIVRACQSIPEVSHTAAAAETTEAEASGVVPQTVTPAELADALYESAIKSIYPGMHIDDLHDALIIEGRTFIERDPVYAYITAGLLLNKLKDEVFGFLEVKHEKESNQESDSEYRQAFIAGINKGRAEGIISEELENFNLEALAKEIKPERDKQFTYLGLQTLYDRYFLHKEERRYELPQTFFMRVAMGLSCQEQNKEEKAIEFYHQLSEFNYMCSTPTLFNSGTVHSQMSSCYLTTVGDHLKGIYKAIGDNAMLSKWAGGLGNDWTPVRAMGAHIKGTNGRSQGVVPFLKVANDTAIAVNQGGKRKGALCSYLETWHLDIEEFLELRKNTGDERRRTHDMNTANWIPDLFMKRVMADAEWTLFSPSDVTDLHDSFGKDFETKYTAHEQAADRGEITNFKRISAKSLWRKMLGMLFETGHPWITFKDVCNLRSPQQHCGVVHSSNLCTEITLNTSADEIAVCNLGSLNLTRYYDDNGVLDTERLRDKIRTAVRMLDNVIDINYYPVPEAQNANKKHRPVGLGIMGFQDILYKKRIPMASMEAVELADELMEQISYYAIEASSDLAQERGAYESYEGSLWSQGILPIDSLKLLKEQRGAEHTDLNTDSKLDWESLRAKIKTQKMRNSNVMAIAPTATIANITGVIASIEPSFQNLYVKSNLSGEFTWINSYLADDLKRLGAWDDVMINDIKYYEGQLADIARVPDELKHLYSTAFEIDPKWLIELAARRQKWIDQAQSLNLYIGEASGKKLDEMYKLAWHKGLKTTYYLRSRAATSVEKSTVDRSGLNNVDVDALKTSMMQAGASQAAAPDTQPAPAAVTEPAGVTGVIEEAVAPTSPAPTSPAPETATPASPPPSSPTPPQVKPDEDFEINVDKACSLDDPECESCQ